MVNFVAKFHFDPGFCELKQINHLVLRLPLYFKLQYIRRASAITKNVEIIKGFRLILFDYFSIEIVVIVSFRSIRVFFFVKYLCFVFTVKR